MIERKLLEDAYSTLSQLELDVAAEMDADEIELCINWLITYGQTIEDLLKLVLAK